MSQIAAASDEGPEGQPSEIVHVPLEHGDHTVELKRLSEEDKADVSDLLHPDEEHAPKDRLPGTLDSAMCLGRACSIL